MMQKTFEWGGKKYPVDRLTVDEAEEFLELAQGLTDENLTPLDQFKASRRMVELLHCPKDLKVYADELADLLAALQAAHFGEPEGEAGNPEGGAVAN